MTGSDGTKLRIRLPGTEQYKNGKRIMMPDPAQMAMIRRIKPDSEIEVYTRTRNDYVLREINLISPPQKKPDKSESAKSEKALRSLRRRSSAPPAVLHTLSRWACPARPR